MSVVSNSIPRTVRVGVGPSHLPGSIGIPRESKVWRAVASDIAHSCEWGAR